VNGPAAHLLEGNTVSWKLSSVKFRDEKALPAHHRQDRIRRGSPSVDESNPYVDARLQDGSRFNRDGRPDRGPMAFAVSMSQVKKEALDV